MKKMLVVLLVGSVFVLNGCAAEAGNIFGETKEVEVCHTSAMDDVDFVSDLSEQARFGGYKAIAQRPLTRAERAYLVKAVKKEESLAPQQKDEIFITLLNNPDMGGGHN